MKSVVVVVAVVALFCFRTLAFARGGAEVARTNVVIKGSVACLDCPRDFDLSGVKILVKCNNNLGLGKLAVAYTSAEGAFEAKLLHSDSTPTDPSNCKAKILGGPQQLYYYNAKGNPEIGVVKGKEESSGEEYTIQKALTFYKTCRPVDGAKTSSCGAAKANANAKANAKKDAGEEEFGSSKTIDLPLPREWGIAPTSYYSYIPFLPIIGIP